ncbi:hypothetical protein JXA32_04010 [Candidatus Sumerlaeota bacterium]|nr:hypothetical protein [Candidatus Sumerlaeota bacterium]
MTTHQHPNSALNRKLHGTVLFMALVVISIAGIATAGLLQLSSFQYRQSHGRWDSHEAWYHAENAMQWAAQQIGDADEGGATAVFLGNYSDGDGDIDLDYLSSMGAGESRLDDIWVTIENSPSGVTDMYRVTSSAKVGEKVRTIQALIRKDPPSVVFDYEYFLNNWGWWWGASITGWGDQRTNWDFDFRYNPEVNGNIFANGSIEENEVAVDPFSGDIPFVGYAGDDPVTYVHPGVTRVDMPNLKDFDYYKDQAQAYDNDNGSQVTQGGSVMIDAVHDDASKPGIYLKGTDANPIVIDGPVVIDGDLVIGGKVTGQGTFYVGGNLYVMDNLTYVNGPDFNSAPASMSQDGRDQWVEDAIGDGKDLVAYAVRESILVGDVNDTGSGGWYEYCWNNGSYGLKNFGDETTLGADGIQDTPDDNIDYLDTDDDGLADSAWYDADGDGVEDTGYNYNNGMKMDNTRIAKIDGYPTQYGNPVAYSNLVPKKDSNTRSYFNTLEGVFYCNHACGMRLEKSHMIIHGSIICHDEAIIFSSTGTFTYDYRVHSRYADDPNRYIDLGLPMAERTEFESLTEITPVAGFYSEGS